MLTLIATLATILLLGVFTARFLSMTAGVIAIALFLTMPLVWTAVQEQLPQLLLVPFVAAWLLALDRSSRSPGWTWPAAAGAALAPMIYLHLVGIVMAPVYLAIGGLALLWPRARLSAALAYGLGFVVFAAPAVLSWLQNPQLLTAPINAYGLYDATRFNFLQGAREITSWTGLTVRTEVYWDYFSPAFLVMGKGGTMRSFLASEVFLLPFALPLVRGLAAFTLAPRGRGDWVVLAGFAVAPIAAALIAQPPVPGRLILIAPFAAIVAARGCYPGAFRTTDAASPAAPAIAVTSW